MAATADTNGDAAVFDEDKATSAMDQYSRQIGTIGVEAQKYLASANILVIGLKGVGIEVAKNAALLGVKSVTVADDEVVAIADLGTNYWLREEHVGKCARAEVCLEELAQLNRYCDVKRYSGPINDDDLKNYNSVIVTCDVDRKTLERWGDVCHNNKPNPILFVVAVTNGLTASLFVDIGNESVVDEKPAHKITDFSGEPLINNVIEAIEYGEDGDGKPLVTIQVDAKFHNLDDGSSVTFNEVDIPELQNGEFKISRVYTECGEEGKRRTILVGNKFTVSVPSIKPFERNTTGGFATEVKEVQYKEFRSFAESVANPLFDHQFFFPTPDAELLFMGRGDHLHFARLGLWHYLEEFGSMPELHNEEHAKKVVEFAKNINEEHKKIVEGGGSARVADTIDEEVVRKTALYARAELPSYCAILGGIAAQEIVKSCGKYTPFHQWLHIDGFDMVDDAVVADAAPQGSRYDHQIAIFGDAVQKKIGAQKWFLVGCGALGCEYMKAIALMGVGADGGMIHITDMDRIEVSNLNRQFLFRPDDVGHPKSTCAGKAGRLMNPSLNIKDYERMVAPSTEDFFNYEFWESLDGVWNALDNVKARKYTDSKIVFHRKPLLESGTLGTKANSETIIPDKTKSYNDYAEQTQETAIPMCTLKLFPHLIDHCIEWARAEFTDVYEVAPKDVNSVLSDAKKFIDTINKEKPKVQLLKLRAVTYLLDYAEKKPTMDDALQLGMNYFLKKFRDGINDLKHQLPQDKTKSDGTPFWTGVRRFPNTPEFDITNDEHAILLQSASNLYAFMFGLPLVHDLAAFRELYNKASVNVPEWNAPVQKMALNENGEEEESVNASEEEASEIEAMKARILESDWSKVSKCQEADFEKDDDTNFHIDFITSASNMRAWNYNIPTASRFKVKMIAGRITPALATTTAMITGVVVNEFYKIVANKGKPIGANVNLALGEFNVFECEGPKKAARAFDMEEGEEVIPIPDGWSTWDKVVIPVKGKTVADAVAAFSEWNSEVVAKMLYLHGATDVIYWTAARGTHKEKLEAYKDRSVVEVLNEVYGEQSGNFVHMAGDFECDDGLASLPPIYFQLDA